jgi:hypothetical protein
MAPTPLAVPGRAVVGALQLGRQRSVAGGSAASLGRSRRRRAGALDVEAFLLRVGPSHGGVHITHPLPNYSVETRTCRSAAELARSPAAYPPPTRAATASTPRSPPPTATVGPRMASHGGDPLARVSL